MSDLSVKANEIRRLVLEQVYNAKSGHPGGSLGIAEILAVLYFYEMNVDPSNPKNPERDRLVLSKGHCSPALYAALALKGFFSVESLKNFRKVDSFLQGHPSLKDVPGVDMSTGSLGQGISAAAGIAYAAKLDNKNYNVFAVMGDGELQEGQAWEAFMFAAHYNLHNLCAIIDLNGLQCDGDVSAVMSHSPLDQKLKAFNWNVIEIDGNNISAIQNALKTFKNNKTQPTAIIAKTIKGKGVSYMENNAGWHGMAPNDEEYKQAMEEINTELGALNHE